MIPTPTDGVARIVAFVRLADATLAHGAARNAAASVAASRSRHLEELRTLRDLRAVEEAFGAQERHAVRPARRRARA